MSFGVLLASSFVVGVSYLRVRRNANDCEVFISASFFRLKLVGYIFDKLCYAQNCILNNSRFAPKLTYLHNTSEEMRGAPRCTFQPWRPP